MIPSAINDCQSLWELFGCTRGTFFSIPATVLRKPCGNNGCRAIVQPRLVHFRMRWFHRKFPCLRGKWHTAHAAPRLSTPHAEGLHTLCLQSAWLHTKPLETRDEPWHEAARDGTKWQPQHPHSELNPKVSQMRRDRYSFYSWCHF